MFIFLLIFLLGSYSCELDKIDPCPCITSISPSTARTGETVTLSGEFVNFDASKDRITIDGMEVVPEDVFGNDIKVKLPAGIDELKVSVVVNIGGCNSNALESCESSFEYKAAMATAINKNTGDKEDTLIITGSNFRDDEAQNSVLFGSVPGTIYSAMEDRLVVLVPVGAETGDVSVIVDGFKTIAGEFTYFYSIVEQSVEVLGTSCAIPNFDRPTGIVADADGNVFVADEQANQIFRIDAITGMKESFAGDVAGTPGDNPIETDLSNSKFNRPWDIALDKDENKYIADFANGKLRKIETDRVSTIADGIIGPLSVAVNQNNDVFFLHITNTIKMLPSGGGTFQDYADGFNNPTGLFVAENGDVYVADTQNHKIKYVEAATGNVIDLAGDGDPAFENGPVGTASFNTPRDVLFDDRDNIFVADTGNNRVRVITPTGYVYTLYGSESSSCLGGLNKPWSIAIHETLQQLTLFVADTENGVVKKMIYE